VQAENIGMIIGRPLLLPLVESEALPATGRGGPQGSETSKLPHFLDNRLTAVRLSALRAGQPPFTLQEDSRYSFLLEAASTPGP
jgi:hypothetical protein